MNDHVLTANLSGRSTGEMTANLSGIGANVARADWLEKNPKSAAYIQNKTLLVVGKDAPETGPAFWFNPTEKSDGSGWLAYIDEEGREYALYPVTRAENILDLGTGAYETVLFGISTGTELKEKLAGDKPVYCVSYDAEVVTPYYLPLMAWNRNAQTAFPAVKRRVWRWRGC